MRKLLFRLYRVLPVRLRWLVSYASASKFVVGIIAFVRRDGKLLLLQHTYQTAWALPGGWLRRGETIEECVRRELREELDLEVGAIATLQVASVATKPVIDVAVVCEALEGAIRTDMDEVTHAQFFPLDALPRSLLATHVSYIDAFLQSIALPEHNDGGS